MPGTALGFCTAGAGCSATGAAPLSALIASADWAAAVAVLMLSAEPIMAAPTASKFVFPVCFGWFSINTNILKNCLYVNMLMINYTLNTAVKVSRNTSVKL
jgi:hypothetical protein